MTKQWAELPPAERRRVLDDAVVRGTLPPDPEVAASATSWAWRQLDTRATALQVGLVVLGIVVTAVLVIAVTSWWPAAVVAALTGGICPLVVDRRRTAHRVLGDDRWW